MLDIVPEKVLICSKVKEESTSKGLYNNRKMKEFYGGDLVVGR